MFQWILFCFAKYVSICFKMDKNRLTIYFKHLGVTFFKYACNLLQTSINHLLYASKVWRHTTKYSIQVYFSLRFPTKKIPRTFQDFIKPAYLQYVYPFNRALSRFEDATCTTNARRFYLLLKNMPQFRIKTLVAHYYLK